MSKLRIIGDVHSKRNKYLSLIEGAEYSLQVGDLDIVGFDWLAEAGVDPEHHKFIGGNHDNYDRIDVPHNLGDFGVWSVPNFGEVFFVRGAWSIDRKRRTFGLDWWHAEELSHQKCEEAIELYAQVKPKILISHACPTNIVGLVADPQVALNWGFSQSVIRTRTDEMLQAMLDHHLPRLHVFGHYHRAYDRWVDGRSGEEMVEGNLDKSGYTRYICLPEFGVLDLDVESVSI